MNKLHKTCKKVAMFHRLQQEKHKLNLETSREFGRQKAIWLKKSGLVTDGT